MKKCHDMALVKTNENLTEAGQGQGAKLWSIVVPHVGIPVAAFFSQLYFRRHYTAMRSCSASCDRKMTEILFLETVL